MGYGECCFVVMGHGHATGQESLAFAWYFNRFRVMRFLSFRAIPLSQATFPNFSIECMKLHWSETFIASWFGIGIPAPSERHVFNHAHEIAAFGFFFEL